MQLSDLSHHSSSMPALAAPREALIWLQRRLTGDLETYGDQVVMLHERYGETYEKDAGWIVAHVQKFAALFGEDMEDVLHAYRRFVQQLVAGYQELRREGVHRTAMSADVDALFEDARFQREYLYALALSVPLNRSRYELYRHVRDAMSRHVPAGARVLEIGGGTLLDAEFLSRFALVDVYDRNPLAECWRDVLHGGPNLRLHVETHRFEQDAGGYDAIVMIELLEHVTDPLAYLRGAFHSLRPGGCAYLTFAIRMPQVDHLSAFDSIDECRELLATAGFAVIEDLCAIHTHRRFADDERWTMANDPRLPVIYACLVRRRSADALAALVADFNDNDA